MKELYSRKIIILTVLMCIIFVVLGTKMADVQLVHGEEAAQTVQVKSIRTYIEPASRGKMTDRNGKTLVSDSPCFMLTFDWYEWDKTAQNDTILRLCELLSERNIEWNDTLALSKTVPYKYTYTDPDNGIGRKLMKFLDANQLPRSIPASRLFTVLCERYGVSEELSSAQKRTVIGVRFYMEDCQFSLYNSPITIASDIDIDTVAHFTGISQTLPGVSVRVSATRQYATEYCAHTLGRTALINSEEYAEHKSEGYGLTDMIGREGLEKTFESYLRGTDGKRAVEVDRKTGEFLGEYLIEDPHPGSTCVLTIDLELQRVAETALADTIHKIKNGGGDIEGGAVVVISCKTGEVLAIASYPTYDPARYNADFKINNSNTLKPFQNRPIMSVYPPGSTFKICTAVAALEEKIVGPYTTIRDEGVYRYFAPSYTPACWLWNDAHRTHGDINVSEALKYSCNYFFYEVGRKMGIERLNKYATMLGLGQKTGIELSGEKAGNLAGPESREKKGGAKWLPAETIQAAIGQTEQQFTPLQLASYIATVVNGGTKYTPHLLKEIKDYTDTQTIYETTPKSEQLNIAKSTVDAVKRGMRGVVTEDGTASSVFRNFPIEVGGKTGSAQTRKGRSAHGVFVSFAPYDDPEIAVCVVGEHAGSGGSVAPVCVEIYKEYFGLNQEKTIEN